MPTYTILALDGHTFEHHAEFSFDDEAFARSEAKRLTAEAKAEAKQAAAEALSTVAPTPTYVAVRTLASINRNTQPSELTIADIRWLAGEAVDTLDFFVAAPDWAKKAIDSVADRRNFDARYIKHVLSAIRCALSVERQMDRQVRKHEDKMANGRKFG